MAVDPEAVRKRLKTLLEEIAGVNRVFEYAPRNISDGDCPAVLIFMAEAEHDQNIADAHHTVRNWRLVLLVGRELSGRYGDLEKKLDQFFERVEDKFAANMKLNELDNELTYAGLLDDSGPARFTWPPTSDKHFFCCEWSLAVEIKRAVTTGT